MTAADVDLALGVWVLETHKTREEDRQARASSTSPRRWSNSTRTLVAKYPGGAAVPGPPRGKPFSRNNVRCRFMRLREKLPHLAHFVATTSATVTHAGPRQRAWASPRSPNSSGTPAPRWCPSVYGHLAGEVAHMREAVRRATG